MVGRLDVPYGGVGGTQQKPRSPQKGKQQQHVCVVHENVFAFLFVVALMIEQVAVAEAVAVAAE